MLAKYDLIVRHLVFPNNLAGTNKIANFFTRKISPNTYFNLMDLSHPTYQVKQYPQFIRVITHEG